MKQEPHESVTVGEGRVKEQRRRLEHCAVCEDQLLINREKSISGINNERLTSKLLDKGQRDKASKEITPFKTMLKIAKKFEQSEKAKVVMQQAKGPTEQVNYTGARNPSKSEQNWGKVHCSQSKSEKEWGQSQSSRQGKIDIYQYCAGPSHPRSIAGFSVTPFKIDQNKNQNHSTDKVQNLGNERR